MHIWVEGFVTTSIYSICKFINVKRKESSACVYLKAQQANSSSSHSLILFAVKSCLENINRPRGYRPHQPPENGRFRYDHTLNLLVSFFVDFHYSSFSIAACCACFHFLDATLPLFHSSVYIHSFMFCSSSYKLFIACVLISEDLLETYFLLL